MVLATLLVLANIARAEGPASQTIDAGPLKLRVVISDSAHVFHAYDQLSLWSAYCHRQYRRHFEGVGGGLNAEDKQLLAAHAEVRGRLRYGVLDQVFYSDGAWEEALDMAVKEKRLSAVDAATERRVFRHFAPRIMTLVEAQRDSLGSALSGLLAEAPRLRTFAERASRFWGGGSVELPMYLVVTPSGSGGGGFNGGKLIVEVGKDRVPTDVAIHEAWHAFSAAQKTAIQNAALRAGTDETTIGEGLAYAVSPGLYEPPGTQRELEARVYQDFKTEKSFRSDPYVRFNRFGLALRPLMKEALESGDETYATFLPNAVVVYQGVAALADAMENQRARAEHRLR